MDVNREVSFCENSKKKKFEGGGEWVGDGGGGGGGGGVRSGVGVGEVGEARFGVGG